MVQALGAWVSCAQAGDPLIAAHIGFAAGTPSLPVLRAAPGR